MTWLFSQAMVRACENSRCSQEPAAESSAGACSAGEPSALLSVMPTPHPFWRRDKTMDASGPFPSGQTCAVLTAGRGEELLTWFRAGFPVRTLVRRTPPARPASTVRRQDSGEKWRASFAKWDRDSSSWRTPQCSLAGGLEEFSETWPAWGSMWNGECWERTSWTGRTCETAFGYWPTPQATDGMRARMKVESMLKVHADSRGGRSYLARVLAHEFGLPQSAEFTEWLMFWPEGWTDSKPLETAKFHEWQQQHGDFSQLAA